MALIIGEKIKELRNKKEIKQEGLAEYLGVTAQAISRWENGNGYPDIETLPALACYFGVTVDFLLGVDQSQQEQDKITLEVVQLMQNGNLKEAITKGRLAILQFPANHSIILSLVSVIVLYIGPKDRYVPENERKELVDEGLLLLKRTMNSDNEALKLTAKYMSCTLLGCADRLDEAAQMAASLPGISYSQELILPRYLRNEQKESYILKILPTLLGLTSALFLSLKYAYSEKGPAFYEYSYEDCIGMLELWNFAYGSKPENSSCKQGQFYYLLILIRLVKLSAEAGAKDKAIGYLREMVKSAEAVSRNNETLLDGNGNALLPGMLSLDKELGLDSNELQKHNIAYILYFGYYKNGYFRAVEEDPAAIELFEKLGREAK